MPDVHLLLEKGSLVNHIVNKKNAFQLENKIIEGSLGFISRIDKATDAFFDNKSVIRLHIESNAINQIERILMEEEALTSEDSTENELLGALIKKLITRVKLKKVRIPFLRKVYESLNLSMISEIEGFMGNVKRIISIITLLNNIPKLTQEEMFSDYLSLDKNVFKNLQDNNLTKKLLPNGSQAPETDSTTGQDLGELIATKRDYYYFYHIASEILGSITGHLSGNGTRVFNTIKEINLDRLRGRAFFQREVESVETILPALHSGAHIDCWAKRIEITNLINVEGAETLSESTINNEIQELCRLGLIEKMKDPQMRRRLVYAILQEFPGASIKFPHPSEINDPIYKGQPVNVINPITGEEETI